MYLKASELKVGDKFRHVNRPYDNEIYTVHGINEHICFFHAGSGSVELGIYTSEVVELIKEN